MEKIITVRDHFVCSDCGHEMEANFLGHVKGGSYLCLNCGSGRLKIFYRKMTEEEFERRVRNSKK